MSHSSALFDALKALVSNRCYPDTFMQPDGALPTWPAIRYSRIGGVSAADLCGDGDESTDSTAFQLDVVAATAAERETLLASVRSALAGMTDPPAVQQGPARSEFDEPTRTYRASVDVVLHGSGS